MTYGFHHNNQIKKKGLSIPHLWAYFLRHSEILWSHEPAVLMNKDGYLTRTELGTEVFSENRDETELLSE